MIELYAKFKFYKGYNNILAYYLVYLEKQIVIKVSKKLNLYTKIYNPSKTLREKWKLDIKYYHRQCYTGTHPDKFYQYTMINETSRERFIYPFKEQSSYSTIQIVKLAISYLGKLNESKKN